MNSISPHKADIEALGENEILIVLDFFYQWPNTDIKIIYNSKTKKINNLQLTIKGGKPTPLGVGWIA